MTEDEARHLLLVRAVETEDPAETLLTRDDRNQATSAALADRRDGGGSSAGGMSKADEAFLARRSEFAFARLATRFPAGAKTCRSASWPAWIGWLLPLAALLLGLATNEIDSGKRLNIIAFPLLGMLAWNFSAYAFLLAGTLRKAAPGRRARASPSRLAGLIARAAAPAQRADAQPPLGRALARFAQDWIRHSSKLSYRRASRTLHLAAAALAAGVIAGMYLRALWTEYRAGWESTFIDASTLHALLALVLGPASALTGIGLPGPEQLEGLRWTAGSRGENAGPWIHLYATTAFLFIIGPRLLLAAWSAARAARLRRRFAIPGAEDFYVRRLLRSARGGGASVRVVPYSFHPPEPAQRQLRRLLGDALGDGTDVVLDTPIPYGSEDEWLGQAHFAQEPDHVLVLFNLSSTPEAENHGALVAGLRRRLAGGGTGIAVLLDESAYRQRLAGQAGAEGRLETRRLAWERMLGQQGVKPLAIDLEASDPALVRRLEGALMQGPELIPAGAAR